MRNAIVGLIVGIVAGIVLGTTVIAPRLAQNIKRDIGLTAAKPVEEENKATTEEASATELDDAKARLMKKPVNVFHLRMASAYPGALAAHGTSARRLSEILWRVSDGRFDLKFHPPGALVANAEAIEAVTSGAIDAYFTGVDALIKKEPALAIFAGPPFGVSVQAYLGWMAHGGDALFQSTLESIGLNGKICGMVPDGGGGWFKKPLKTVDDFKGLRMRAVGVMADVYKRLGAEVLSFPYAETLIALEQGLLDGAELSAPHVDLALGVASNNITYYLPSWRKPALTFALVMSNATWETLSPIQKSQLDIVCGENIAHTIAEAEALQFNALKEITRKGTDVRPWPSEIRDAVKAAWLEEARDHQKENRLYSKAIKSYRLFIKGQSVWEELARP